MPRFLAIDTALDRCAAAVVCDGEVLSEHAEDMRVGHAERLFTLIDAALDSSRIAYGELDALAVVAGPGSFSGIRIGVAAARGLALARGIPAIGVGTLEGLAADARHQVPDAARIVAANTAPLGRSFIQQFAVHDDRLQPVTAADMLNPDQREAMIKLLPAGTTVIGNDVDWATNNALQPMPNRGCPSLAAVAQVAAARMSEAESLPSPSPIYLRPPDAKPRSHAVTSNSQDSGKNSATD